MNRDALVIGVNRYPFLKDPVTQASQHLTTPAKDAEELAHLLETQGKFTVRRFPHSLIDGRLQVDPMQQVTKEELKEAIAHLFNPNTGNPPDVASIIIN
ncbi:MAG TPA: caspase family protein [Nostocaceae cyanobacterium]|nr:caspase family protein [Nostocaceae cyanobacterium]